MNLHQAVLITATDNFLFYKNRDSAENYELVGYELGKRITSSSSDKKSQRSAIIALHLLLGSYVLLYNPQTIKTAS